MNIHKATQSYENWMRSCTAVIEADLRLKHKDARNGHVRFDERGRETAGCQ
jgi:hypothetical protein